MLLLTKKIKSRLESNAALADEAILNDRGIDLIPAVKLFDPCGGGTWLFTELRGNDQLFGLCDPGLGSPELGYASLAEITAWCRYRAGYFF